ncbi:MAG: AlpA family transcriptional regulator [Methylococcaceae bacterium]|jgi:hypothetical protein
MLAKRKSLEVVPGLPETGFVRVWDIVGDKKRNIKGVFPVSLAAWHNGVKSGIYPKPVNLAPRTVGWRVEDIKAMLEKFGTQDDAA